MKKILYTNFDTALEIVILGRYTGIIKNKRRTEKEKEEALKKVEVQKELLKNMLTYDQFKNLMTCKKFARRGSSSHIHMWF